MFFEPDCELISSNIINPYFTKSLPSNSNIYSQEKNKLNLIKTDCYIINMQLLQWTMEIYLYILNYIKICTY